MKDNLAQPHTDLVAAVDAYGSDLAQWPDGFLANKAREVILADRDFRAYFDGARALAGGLAASREALDRDIRASGAIERVTAATMARRPVRRHSRWMAAAAAVVIAAGIGGVIDARFMAGAGQQTIDVVVLDPLVLDPLDTDVE
jgi:hypothetical protein